MTSTPDVLTSSRVQGFSIEVTKKEGCLLQTPSSESEGVTIPSKNVAPPHHLEAVVTYDGSNPLYPNKPRSWTFFLTETTTNVGEGVMGGVYFLPPNQTFCRIEVVEEYEQAGMDDFGNRWQAHHMVWVRLFSQGTRGMQQGTSTGIMQRNP